MGLAQKLVYPAQSKLAFYSREAVCEFVLKQGAVPLHPFMIFGYFLSDRVDRDIIRNANNTVVSRVDEIWVFGDTVANGVLAEIDLANSLGKPVKYFNIATRAREIGEMDPIDLTFEEEVLKDNNHDIELLRDVVTGRRTLRNDF
ncbi:hypothetical protein ACIHDR_03575 [Nocardia sp. NPDC052278]|uniref:DUF7768 domain-containing protein n=1 Tax=unclassified Nocardia TaxID=2637762 RepID=UPI003698F673